MLGRFSSVVSTWLLSLAAGCVCGGNVASEQLVEAIWRDDVGSVSRFLRRGGSPNAVVSSFSRDTLLHAASASGSTNVLRALLDAGANREARNSQGDIALTYAVEHGHMGLASDLLPRRPQPEGREAALCVAVLQKSLLGEHDPGPCYLAVNGRDPHPEVAAALARDGIRVRPVSQLKEGDAADCLVSVVIMGDVAGEEVEIEYHSHATVPLAGHGFRARARNVMGEWVIFKTQGYEM